jgi:hypothetical protein
MHREDQRSDLGAGEHKMLPRDHQQQRPHRPSSAAGSRAQHSADHTRKDGAAHEASWQGHEFGGEQQRSCHELWKHET